MNFRDRYTPDADLIARKVMAERVKVFTDRAVAAAMTSPLGTLLLAGVQAMVAGWGRALAWLCLINLIELLIIGIGYRHRRLQSGGGDAPTEPGWLTFAVFLVGLAWGSSVWFFWTEGQFLFYLLNLTVLVGVSGICVIVMSPVRMAMSLFTGGILLLPILHLALVRNPLSLEIAAGLAILFVLELQYGRVAEKQLVDGLAHEAYNEALLAELAQRSVALEASKHELDRAQAVGNVGSWSYDIATDIMRLSAETCRIFGLPEGVTGNREVRGGSAK